MPQSFWFTPFSSSTYVPESRMGSRLARTTRWLGSPAANQTAWLTPESLASQITSWPPSSVPLKTFKCLRTSNGILLQCTQPCEQFQKLCCYKSGISSSPLAPNLVLTRVRSYSHAKVLLKNALLNSVQMSAFYCLPYSFWMFSSHQISVSSVKISWFQCSTADVRRPFLLKSNFMATLYKRNHHL